MSARQEASFSTSTGIKVDPAPRPFSSFTASSDFCLLRAATTMVAPALASPRAIPKPMPPLPPGDDCHSIGQLEKFHALAAAHPRTTLSPPLPRPRWQIIMAQPSPLSALSGALKIADKVNGHYGCGGDRFA